MYGKIFNLLLYYTFTAKSAGEGSVSIWQIYIRG